MGSLIEELRRREAAARAEADRLRLGSRSCLRSWPGRRGGSRGWRSPGRRSPGSWKSLPSWSRRPVRRAGPAAAPGLWVRPGQAYPHELGGDAIRRAVAADARGSRILPQILTAAVLDVVLKIIRDLDDVHALSDAFADDLTARANSGGQIVDLMHAHAHAIVLSYSHALDLARADVITRTCAADPDLVRDLGLAPARALADAIAGDLASAMSLARTSAVRLARAVDQDLNVLSAFDFDLAGR